MDLGKIASDIGGAANKAIGDAKRGIDDAIAPKPPKNDKPPSGPGPDLAQKGKDLIKSAEKPANGGGDPVRDGVSKLLKDTGLDKADLGGLNKLRDDFLGSGPKHDKPGDPPAAGPAPAGPKPHGDNSSLDGLTGGALAEVTKANDKGIRLISGKRQDSLPEHPSGKAVDISNGTLTPEMEAHAEDLRRRGESGDPAIEGVIYNNRIAGYGNGWNWSDYGSGHTGSPTQDHQDHIHVKTA